MQHSCVESARIALVFELENVPGKAFFSFLLAFLLVFLFIFLYVLII